MLACIRGVSSWLEESYKQAVQTSSTKLNKNIGLFEEPNVQEFCCVNTESFLNSP